MGKSKTISETQSSSKSDKEKSKSKNTTGYVNDYIKSKTGNDRSIKRRYKDLWRSRLKNKDVVEGFSIAYITGLFFVLLAGWGLPTFTFLIASTSLFVIGSIIGSIFAGYSYDFDSFLGFHIGIFSSIPMLLLYSSIIMFVNPFNLLYIIPLLLINTVISGLGTYIYTSIGRKRKNVSEY